MLRLTQTHIESPRTKRDSFIDSFGADRGILGTQQVDCSVCNLKNRPGYAWAIGPFLD